MEIHEIKSRLSILEVLSHYGLTPDKNQRLCCPFHPDKTPSLQIYPKTNTYCCFSANCKAGTGDQVQFIELMEGQGKHAAIEKAKSLCGAKPLPVRGLPPDKQKELLFTQISDAPAMAEDALISLLTRLFAYFRNAIKVSPPAKEYAASRLLDIEKLETGYNGGQFHHGKRRDEELINQCLEAGILKPLPTGNGYFVFAKNCLIFPLRNKQGNIISLYGRSTISDTNRHYYLQNRKGLYPCYPPPGTKRLVLTESIIDAATLLQIPAIIENYTVLALYGTEGFKEQYQAIGELQALEEIILFLNGDEAGKTASRKRAAELQGYRPGVTVSIAPLPDGEDINSLQQGHEPEIFADMLQLREAFHIPAKNRINDSAEEEKQTPVPLPEAEPVNEIPLPQASRLDAANPEQIHYHSGELLITLLGGISLQNLDRLRVTLYMRRNPHINPSYSIRQNLDLYQDEAIEKFIRRAAEKLEIPTTLIGACMASLTEEAESWRLGKLQALKTDKPKRKELSFQEINTAKENLKRENLMEWTMEQYGHTGIIGELTNAMILHFAMTSSKQDDPVSVICLSASGMGKSYLQERVAACFPEEIIVENTQMTENSFYYFGRDEIRHKIFLIEDMDGVSLVEYVIRELISKKRISKTVTLKDSKGNLKTVTLTVEGPVTFCGCTTREKLYEDNANRALLIYLDNSQEQDGRIMDYHKKARAGLIDRDGEQVIREQLKNMQRLIKPRQVINLYAPLLELPQTVFKPRRTLSLLLSFIESITLYHQYQCEEKNTAPSGALLTHPLHIEWGFKLLKETLFRKSDELNASQRSFLERLEGMLKEQDKKSFYASAIRKGLRIPPRTLARYLYELQSYGYLKIAGGNKYRKGYEYELVPEQDKLREDIGRHIESLMEKVWEAHRERTGNKGAVSQYAAVGQNGFGALKALA